LSQEVCDACAAEEEFILAVTENGYGKRRAAYEYRVSGRGGQGIASIDVSKRNGEVVGLFPVNESDELMMISNAGQVIRIPVNGIRIAGRSTQGVTLFNTADDETVVSVTRLAEDDMDDGDEVEDEADEASAVDPESEPPAEA